MITCKLLERRLLLNRGAAAHIVFGWCDPTTPLLDGQHQQHDNSKAAILMIAATQVAAENINYGKYAVTAQLLYGQCRRHDNVQAAER